MFTIGSRTIKTAIGAMVALVIAQLLSLDNASTAAIITLLSVQSTKKQSIDVAFRRFSACIAGMALATLLFEGTAYTPLTIGLLLFIYIPIMAKLGLQDGIVPGFVIIMQLYVEKGITVDLILNEVLLIGIGIIVALLVNLYMPSTENTLRKMAKETEENMKLLLLQLSRFIRKKEPVWNDEFEIKTTNCIKNGRLIAKRTVENSFSRKENYYDQYFKMRSQQISLMKRVIPTILDLPSTFEQSNMVANFIENMALCLAEDNPGNELLEDLRNLKATFVEMELPKTREEFETRAALLILINEIERFIQLKMSFYEEVTEKKMKE
ncbi:aromatic acid exporter family protein [Bacillus massiliigorillae]|uniref:aromatic acid exporter family protein n=1 Tax=Bacillus massiliigorillae TaxID=1243664 RepID=UPI00039E95A3|nr:aromatic acid exporter family protein [Bacillus massiliigorillae]